jgi:hypothetical protein
VEAIPMDTRISLGIFVLWAVTFELAEESRRSNRLVAEKAEESGRSNRLLAEKMDTPFPARLVQALVETWHARATADRLDRARRALAELGLDSQGSQVIEAWMRRETTVLGRSGSRGGG